MSSIKSKADRGLTIAPNEGLAAYGFGSADYIVPGYTDEGRCIRAGGPVAGGEQALTKAARRILGHALANGGAQYVPPTPQPAQPLVLAKPMKQKPGRPVVKAVEKTADHRNYPKPLSDFANMPVTLPHDGPIAAFAPVEHAEPSRVAGVKLPVVFNTQFGKMRMIVHAVLQNDIGFALVFNDEDEVRFVPEQGSSLSVTLPGGITVTAMYTGCLFAWPDDTRQIMFFIKDINEQTNE